MLRLIALCTLMVFTAGDAFTQSPPGIKPPPPRGAKPPPDPSLGPPPKPKPAPRREGEVAALIAPAPIFGPDPDPSIPANPKAEATLRAILTGLENGTVNEALLSPPMVESFRAGRESLIAYMQTFGAMKSLAYKGAVDPVNPAIIAGQRVKIEEYESLHEQGTMRWRFLLRPDGKVARIIAVPRLD